VVLAIRACDVSYAAWQCEVCRRVLLATWPCAVGYVAVWF
jgi:hypothetical protein